jgi:hypothetical protein
MATLPTRPRPFDTASAFPAPAAPPVTSPCGRDAGAPLDREPAQPSAMATSAARVGWLAPAMIGVKLRYILLGDGRGGGVRDSSAIAAWVAGHGTPVTSVDGALYDLAGAVSES